ncbi:hypothetical protein BW892_27560 [Bacillus cereus]|uniref:Transposase putative helix-turn-helix domain-containing protein n=1 Tax=Bacillus cereus TaxID=1396 RepID=A0A1S9U565_BACCE|nr:helix-turn-helix domain-containing protein [Bacillus sp. RIT 809]OOR17376.1 hypothetical protein BW892_27560 [Bacillus cereus]
MVGILFKNEVHTILVKQAYIFRIYPNKKQVLLIPKSIGYCYFVFNRLLSL